jgi:hypothetical protein
MVIVFYPLTACSCKPYVDQDMRTHPQLLILLLCITMDILVPLGDSASYSLFLIVHVVLIMDDQIMPCVI